MVLQEVAESRSRRVRHEAHEPDGRGVGGQVDWLFVDEVARRRRRPRRAGPPEVGALRQIQKRGRRSGS
jgi:hypothetical protein